MSVLPQMPRLLRVDKTLLGRDKYSNHIEPNVTSRASMSSLKGQPRQEHGRQTAVTHLKGHLCSETLSWAGRHNGTPHARKRVWTGFAESWNPISRATLASALDMTLLISEAFQRAPPA